jgi:hypothetical protein
VPPRPTLCCLVSLLAMVGHMSQMVASLNASRLKIKELSFRLSQLQGGGGPEASGVCVVCVRARVYACVCVCVVRVWRK